MRKVLTILLCAMIFGMAEAQQAFELFMPEPTLAEYDPSLKFEDPRIRTLQYELANRNFQVSHGTAKLLLRAIDSGDSEQLDKVFKLFRTIEAKEDYLPANVVVYSNGVESAPVWTVKRGCKAMLSAEKKAEFKAAVKEYFEKFSLSYVEPEVN